MVTAAVTGCAGFIGSHLTEACLARGMTVIGVDSLTGSNDFEQKRSNLATLSRLSGFSFINRDLRDGCDDLFEGVNIVFHLAGKPGVRSSWHRQFDDYLEDNIRATQRVLEAAANRQVARLVFASSSSVYGNADSYPVDETMRPKPFSPYGVTKLAAEHLCQLYESNLGLSVVALRYFTVYGPRQRSDMAIHRLFEAALHGTKFPLFGNGEQRRDFTYVGDVVRANLLAGLVDVPAGTVANIAGGSKASILDLIRVVEEITGRSIELDLHEFEPGDVSHTGANIDRAYEYLGWSPEVSLRSGLELQYRWHLSR